MGKTIELPLQVTLRQSLSFLRKYLPCGGWNRQSQTHESSLVTVWANQSPQAPLRMTRSTRVYVPVWSFKVYRSTVFFGTKTQVRKSEANNTSLENNDRGFFWNWIVDVSCRIRLSLGKPKQNLGVKKYPRESEGNSVSSRWGSSDRGSDDARFEGSHLMRWTMGTIGQHECYGADNSSDGCVYC